MLDTDTGTGTVLAAAVPAGYPGPRRPMVAAQLRLASEAVHRAMFGELRRLGFDDLRDTHYALFRFPGPHGRTPTQLAAHLGISKQALHPLLNELEEAGYLRRVPDPSDGRGRVLELTGRGFELVTAIRESLERIEAAVAAQVGPRAYRQLTDALGALRDLPDPTR